MQRTLIKNLWLFKDDWHFLSLSTVCQFLFLVSVSSILYMLKNWHIIYRSKLGVVIYTDSMNYTKKFNKLCFVKCKFNQVHNLIWCIIFHLIMSVSIFPCGKAKRMARELDLWYQTNGTAAITSKQHARSFSIFSQFAEVLWLNVECQLWKLLASQIIKVPSEP